MLCYELSVLKKDDYKAQRCFESYYGVKNAIDTHKLIDIGPTHIEIWHTPKLIVLALQHHRDA